MVATNGGNDAAEHGERLVDIGALGRHWADRASRLGGLAASQVNDADARSTLRYLACVVEVVVHLLRHDGEDGVRAARR